MVSCGAPGGSNQVDKNFIIIKLNTIKAGVHIRKFFTDRKSNSSKTRKYFLRVEKNFRRADKA